MKISIFGLGYVGLTSAACLVEQGHQVIGVDLIQSKIAMVNRGESPINEPGVENLISKAVKNGMLSATVDVEYAVNNSDIAFICVGTPSDVSGAHDMTYVLNVSAQISEAISRIEKVGVYEVIYRSTMAPGSIEEMIMPIFDRFDLKVRHNYELYYNPEFLREGTAVADYHNPPKIVVGSRGNSSSTRFLEIYKDIDAEIFEVGYRESEITKFLDNSFHALKVAFGNEVGRICETLNIDANAVMDIFLADKKLNISPLYLRPGGAFGGSCLPKDVRALQFIASSNGVSCEVVENILKSNNSHKSFLLERVVKRVVLGGRILVVGISFKKDTDDLRESPQVDLIQQLIGRGYEVSIYDPDIYYDGLIGKNLAFSISHIKHLKDRLLTIEQVSESVFDTVVFSKDIDLPPNAKYQNTIRTDVL